MGHSARAHLELNLQPSPAQHLRLCQRAADGSADCRVNYPQLHEGAQGISAGCDRCTSDCRWFIYIPCVDVAPDWWAQVDAAPDWWPRALRGVSRSAGWEASAALSPADLTPIALALWCPPFGSSTCFSSLCHLLCSSFGTGL